MASWIDELEVEISRDPALGRVCDWLVKHGLDPKLTRSFLINSDGIEGLGTLKPITITAQVMAVDEHGNKYANEDRTEVVMAEPVTVPLICWPENV